MRDGIWTYGWEHGRELAGMTNLGENITFEYNADGLRISKTVEGVVHNYVYSGGKLVEETYGDTKLNFSYDANGNPYTFSYTKGNNSPSVYHYVLNLQGDVVRIVTNKGVTRVTYEYDAWGNITNMTYTNKTLADANPLRYRGYYYDQETGLYYLQSRYYNPQWGRFINSDAYISTGQGIIGNNMFAYCLNNPVNYIDRDGANAEAIQWWTAGIVWLPFADTVLPVGDIIYFGGLLILGGVTLSTDQYYIPEISYDEAEVVYSPPPPNNDDDEFDDDDLDDDYYNDDRNFGGRQKIGKPKGKTPGNNQAQNKQFNDATKDILNKDQQQKLHKELSKEGFGFHNIVDAAKNFWFVFLGLFGIDDQ